MNGFGTEERGADGNLTFADPLLLRNLIVIVLCNFLSQMCDRLAVLFLLERKTEHKVQLYFVPATVERLIRAIQDNFLCQSLIDNIAHPLGTGFRCKGQAALFYVLHLAHDHPAKRRRCAETEDRH